MAEPFLSSIRILSFAFAQFESWARDLRRLLPIDQYPARLAPCFAGPRTRRPAPVRPGPSCIAMPGVLRRRG